MARFFRRDPRSRALADIRRHDIVQTRDGWLVDLAADRRLAAVGVLAGAQGDDVLDALLGLLDDPLDNVRAAAIRALGARASDAGARACAREAASWDPACFPASREAAWSVVEHAEADDVAEILAGALLSRDVTGAIDAPADVLATVVAHRPEQADDVLDIVLARLGDRDPEIASRAMQLAVGLGAHHEGHLTAALGDERSAPRAARALGEFGSLSSVAPLAELLGSARPAAGRVAAARALGSIGGHEAARVLRASVDDPDPQVRRAVAGALAPLAAVFPAQADDGPTNALMLLPPAEPLPSVNRNGHVETLPSFEPEAAPTVEADPHPVPDGRSVVLEDPAPVAVRGETFTSTDEPAHAEPDDVDDELDDLDPDEFDDDDPASGDIAFDDRLADDVSDDSEEEEPAADAIGSEPIASEPILRAVAEAPVAPAPLSASGDALVDEPAPWSGPKTNGTPAVGPRMKPARASVPRRRVASVADRRPLPRGPRPQPVEPSTDVEPSPDVLEPSRET